MSKVPVPRQQQQIHTKPEKEKQNCVNVSVDSLMLAPVSFILLVRG
jgi:hypothetical protein